MNIHQRKRQEGDAVPVLAGDTHLNRVRTAINEYVIELARARIFHARGYSAAMHN